MSHWKLALVVLGAGLLGFCSIAMPAMTSVAMTALGAPRTGLASGVLNTARQTGGALGTAVLGALLTVVDGGSAILLRIPMAVVVVAYLAAMGLTITATQRRSAKPAPQYDAGQSSRGLGLRRA